jgi:uncharacterized protein
MPDQLDTLRGQLDDLGSVVVAFSGGADSSFLAWVAHDTLGRDRCSVVTAVSPSLAGDEEDDCRDLAEEWGLRWSTVATDEADRDEYLRNDNALLPLQERVDGRAHSDGHRRHCGARREPR